MILESVPLMTAIDLLVLGVASYLAFLFFRHRQAARRLGISRGLGAVLTAVTIVAGLYLADLYAMTVLPMVSSPEHAMRFKTSVHLEWSWFAAVLSTAAIAFGFRQLVGGLVPRLASTIDELRSAEQSLRENQALLERRVEERTAALARTERQFRLFMDHSPDACHLKDRNGRYLFTSRTFEDWLGVETGSALGRRFSEFVDAQAAGEVVDALDRRVLEGEGSVRETMQVVVAGQAPRTIEVSKFPVLDDDGSVVSIGTISRDVTQALARERALEESEARYALAAAGGTSGIWDWDLDKGELHLSARLRELLAFTDERATPPPDEIVEVLHPEDRARYMNTLKAHLAGETPVFTGEFRMVGDDGRVRWVLDRGIGQRDASGRVHRMAGSVLDITEEVEQRARTAEAERRLALALEHVADGVALFDADDRLVICNDTWRFELNGEVSHLLEPGVTFETYQRAVLERELVADAIGHEDEWLERRLRERRSGGNEVEIRMSDGTWRLVRETVVEDGSLVLVASPITELKRRELALAESERRFRDLTEASSDWYWEMDAELRFTYLSEGLEERAGVSASRFLGQRRQDVMSTLPDSTQLRQHLDDLEARRPFRDFQYAIDVDDGERRYMRISGVPVFDDAGGFTGYRGVGADITAMVEAERGRASAEERLSAAIECVDDTYAVFDRDDRLVISNEAYRRHYRAVVGEDVAVGTTFAETMTAMLAKDAVDVGEVGPAAWLARRIARHKEPPAGEDQVIHTGGRWFRVTEARTSFDDTVLVARDITELTHRAQSLRESEQRLIAANRMFRLVIDTIPIRVFWKDRGGRYIGCNLGFARDAGYQDVYAVVGRDDRELPWASNAERYRQEDLHVIESGTVLPVPEETLTLGGRERTLRTTKLPLEDARDNVIGMLGIYEDVTETRAAEAERDRVRLQLQAAVEQSPAGIVLTVAPAPRLKVFNQAAMDILLPQGALPGDLAWLEKPPYPWRVLDENGHELPPSMMPLGRAERDGVVSRNLDLRLRFPDGQEKQLLVNAGPVRDEAGTIYGGVIVFVDVTEQRRAEAEVRRLNTELEARVEARTAALRDAVDDLESFSYSVSHDLRAPLRHVAGYIDLLERHAADSLDEKSLRYLEVIDGAAERMGELIDDLLEFSRTGRTAIQRAPVDLRSIVMELRAELVLEAGRTIDWRIGDLPPVQADRGLMRHVMANLIGNAVKFSATRDVAVIEVGCEPADDGSGERVYFVRDNGVGYDARYRDKLFGVFQRLHAQSEFEGTGIGLAIVHRIITRHGGRVWSASDTDRGATFYFTVPATGADIT